MDTEIWREFETGLGGMGILVSDHGNIKNREWRDRTISDNGNGYRKCTYPHMVDGICTVFGWKLSVKSMLDLVRKP